MNAFIKYVIKALSRLQTLMLVTLPNTTLEKVTVSIGQAQFHVVLCSFTFH